MNRVGLFWLNDVQWAAIEPHLPMVHTGPRRVDERVVISGIVHRFHEGWRCRAEHIAECLRITRRRPTIITKDRRPERISR